MATIQEIIDGDTLRTEEGKVRVGYIDAPESVHPDKSKNVPEGKTSSEFASDVLPEGSEVETETITKDAFGRNVSSVTRVINDTPIDMGLVTLDQNMASYYTKYGEHPNPMIHQQYQEFFSKEIPYQFGAYVEPLSDADFESMTVLHDTFAMTKAAFDKGEATQEELDAAMVALYADGDKVARYRNQLYDWNKPVEEESTYSLRGMMKRAFEVQPELQQQYNQMAKGGFGTAPVEEQAGFMDKVGASWDAWTAMANLGDMHDLYKARNIGSGIDLDLPEDEFYKGVPEEFHSMIAQELATESDMSALALRDNIVEDIQNGKVLDNMPLYQQFLYGGGVQLLDPTTYIGGAVASKGALAVTGAATKFVAAKSAQRLVTVGAWAGAGGLEQAAYNMPMLAGDVTYDSRNYMADIMFGAAIVGGGDALVQAGSPVFKKTMDFLDARQAEKAAKRQEIHANFESGMQSAKEAQRDGFVDNLEKTQAPTAEDPTPREFQYKVPATLELIEVGHKAASYQVADVVRQAVASMTKTPLRPFESIDRVSQQGFQAAFNTVAHKYKRNNPVGMLARQQNKFNNSTLSPELRSLADELNAEVVHIMAASEKGKLPRGVANKVQTAAFKQREVETVNALELLSKGEAPHTYNTIRGYVHALKDQPMFKEVDLQKTTWKEFYTEFSDLLEDNVGAITEDLADLTKKFPEEVSFIRDVAEINKQLISSADAEVRDLVEQLNGIALHRYKQLEGGDTKWYRDTTRSWGEKVKLSPQEVQAQMRAEGWNPADHINPEWETRKDMLQRGGMAASEASKKLREEGLSPRTKAYTDRLNQLKRSNRKVAPEINDLGKLEEYTVKREFTEVTPDIEEYYTTTDLREELESLQKLSSPEPEDKARAKEINRQLETKQFTTKELSAESTEGQFLPRSYNRSTSESAYSNPTLENMTRLNNTLKRINKELGTKVLHGKTENKAQQVRVGKVANELLKDKQAVINRMVKAGKWENVEDVILAANQIVDAKTLAAKNQPKVEGAVQARAVKLTEENLETLLDDNSGRLVDQVPDEEFKGIKEAVADGYGLLVEKANQDTAKHLTQFVTSGEKKAFQLAKKPTGPLDYAGRIAGKITEDTGSKLQNSKLTSLEYFGSRVTEIGRGYGGEIRRKATGAVIKDVEFRQSIVQILPQYVRTMDKYAVSKGKSALGQLKAQQQAGADNKVVEQFNRDVFTVQELRRQGKQLPSEIDKSVLEFVDQWDKYMEYNHDRLVTEGIGGFTSEKKVKNYIPHIWLPNTVEAVVSKHGEAKVLQLLTKGYESAIRNGTNPSPLGKAPKMAEDLLKWIRGQNEEAVDQFMPVKDSRAKHRQDIDTTIEVDGLSVMDLLDTEVASLATKYSQRVSGWVALAKSTDGLLNTQLNIDALKQNMLAEAAEKGIKSGKYEQYFDDVIDSMFGRPTRGGLTKELRELKDLTALTRMGGLGTAQAIETGQVITRSVVDLFSSERVAGKLLKDFGNKDQESLIREIQSFSAMTDDFEWLDRQSVHLDQAEVGAINKARQLSLWFADKATTGAAKAPASRLLGKVSGYNMVRRYQSRFAQMSFTVDVARHFKSGKGVMGNARMADLGLTDSFGKDVDLEEAFSKYVEFDDKDYPVKMNFDKWSKEAREKFQYAIARDEAQQIQRTLVGELPPWMNSPIMGLLMQFRQMPIVANNKQLGRNMAFADKEAAMSVLLNSAIAGMVRYSKFAVLGAGVAAITGDEISDPTAQQMQVQKYIASAGIFPDAHDLVLSAWNAGKDEDSIPAGAGNVGKEVLMGQVPVMGLIKDYIDAGVKSGDDRISAAFGLLPLGNVAFAELAHAWILDNFGD